MDLLKVLRLLLSEYIPGIENVEVYDDYIVIHVAEHGKIDRALSKLLDKGLIKNYSIDLGVVRVVPSMELFYRAFMTAASSFEATYGPSEGKRGVVVLDIGVLSVYTKCTSLLRSIILSEILARSLSTYGFKIKPIVVLDDLDRDFSILLWAYDRDLLDLLPPYALVRTLKILSEIKELRSRLEDLKREGRHEDAIKLLSDIDGRVGELAELKDRYGSAIDHIMDIVKDVSNVEDEWNRIHRAVLKGSRNTKVIADKVYSHLSPLFKLCKLDIEVVLESEVLIRYGMIHRLTEGISKALRVGYTEKGVEVETLSYPGRLVVMDKSGLPTYGIRRLLVDLWLLEKVKADQVLILLSTLEEFLMSRILKEVAYLVGISNTNRVKLVGVGRVQPHDMNLEEILKMIESVVGDYDRSKEVLKLSLVLNKRNVDVDLRDEELLLKCASFLDLLVRVRELIRHIEQEKSKGNALRLVLHLMKFSSTIEKVIEKNEPSILVLYLRILLEELYSLIKHQCIGKDIVRFCREVIEKATFILGFMN